MMNEMQITQGRRMTSVRFLSSVLFLATVLLQPLSASAAEGKFHLVYLVSTDKVEVGATAYVEPLFFTDGRTVIGAWSYCAGQFRKNYCEKERDDRFCKDRSQTGKVVLQNGQIAGEAHLVDSYCSNKSVTWPGKNYHLLSNDGASVKVENIDFGVTPQTEPLVDNRFVIPPALAMVGKARITRVAAEPATKSPSSAADDSPRYFFLMASDEALLQRIVPVVRYSQDQAQSLLRRSLAYAEKTKGEIRSKDRQSPDKDGKFSKLKPELIAPIFADLDQDGTMDVIVGVRAGPAQSMNNPSMPMYWHWAGTAILMGKGEPLLFSRLYQSGSFKSLVTSGYSMNTPWGLIRLNNCTYLITSLLDGAHVPMTFDFLAMPQESTSCKNFVVFRQLEDVENIYPPR